MTGTGTAYALTSLNGVPTNFKFANGLTAINLTINGALGAGTLTGSYSLGNYADTFSFTQNGAQTHIAASLGKLAGTYASSTGSSELFIGHIEANGRIWGSSAGVAYSGVIQVIDPNINIYQVTLAYSQNGTYSFVSGLASFYDVSPTDDALPEPTALVADGYTGELSSLGYSQTVTGSHGKVLLQLTSPLQQIFVNAVRMTTQIQTIAIKPTVDSMMLQSVGNPTFLITATGNIQYSGSAAATLFAGAIQSSTGIVNVISNPGDIVLSGADSIRIQGAPASSGLLIPVCDPSSIVVTPPVGTLIITANPACKTYDGHYYSGGNGVSYNGFLNGDTPAVLSGTLTYGGTSQDARNAGTYTITPGGLTSSSYNITFVDGSLTVKQAPLTVTGTNNVYGGSFTPGGTSVGGSVVMWPGGSISISGPFNGATLSNADAANYSIANTASPTGSVTVIAGVAGP